MKAILYDWGGANEWLFHAINNVRGNFIDRFMLLGTQLGSHTHFPDYLTMAVVLGLFVLTQAFREDNQLRLRLALRWFAALGIFSLGYTLDGALLSRLKPFFDFPRPPLLLPAGKLYILGTPEYYYSLPSGHAVFTMLLAVSFWRVLNSAGRIAIGAFVLWVGVSRVSVGAHFPADIVAAWVFSLVVTLLVSLGVNHALGLRFRYPC